MPADHPVTITDMMLCREKRAAIQHQFIEQFHSTVISFCMNIPGPVKTNADIHTAFESGCKAIFDALDADHITVLDQLLIQEKTGDELLLCVKADAPSIKKKMCLIEETHPLGRLYDMDVIDSDGNKLSRNRYRKCLLCGCQAQECARSRKHSIDEMFTAVMHMIHEWQTTTAS